TANLTIVDNDALVQFSQATYQVNENGTVIGAALTINRTGLVNSAGSVDVQLTNGTATGGTDFNNTTQTINFASGETSHTVTIPITDDTLVEGNENLSLTLANPTGNFVLGTQKTATVDIVDNDTDVTLAVSPSSVAEDGTNNLSYTFTRTGITSTPLTVNFTVGGTATYNTDYTVSGANTFNGSTGTLTFAANSTTATVTIDPTADSTLELDETVQLTLANGSNYNAVTNTAVTGTIINDDAAVEFSQANYQINEDGTVIGAAVTIDRTGLVNSAGNVQVQFTNGSATGGTDFNPTTQTINFLANETSKTVTISINDDNLSEGIENFTVSLANPSSGISIGTQNTATVQIIDNDVPPTLAISDIAQVEGNNGTTNLVFTVSLNTPSAQTITVNYATQNGTATTADNDYNSASNTLTFNPGETQKTVSIVVNGDTKYESDETFEVKLSNPTNATIADDTGVGTIKNDDQFPAISISNATAQNEGNSGTLTHSFNVSLTNVSSQTISVNFNTADGTASVADGDYTSTSGNLIFNPGETQKTITVNSNGDTKYETNETFNLNLSNPINATITNAAAVGTINNDDSLPTIAISDVTQNEGNSGTTNFNFAVTLSNPSYQTVSVNYATADGISVAGKDYNSASGVLTFNPGETTKNITVTVNGNTLVETNKNFFLKLNNASNGTIANNQAVGTILNDDNTPVGNSISKSGDEDTTISFTAVDFTSKFSNANGASLSKIKVTTLPTNGTLQLGSSNVTVNQEISQEQLANLRFTPVANWNGNTSFNWLGFDGANYANADAAVNLTINPVNDAPVVNLPVNNQTATVNSLFNFTFAADSFKDIDVGDTLTYSASLTTGNPLPSWLTFNPSSRNFIGIPTANDAGSINIFLKATDSANSSVNIPFSLTVGGGVTSVDADCFASKIVRPDINNLPGVSLALNSVDNSQFGTDGQDLLIGSDLNDALSGNNGDDLLLGRTGNDNLFGGKGKDSLFGGEGRDWIAGNEGDDFLNGNLGDDVVNGNQGNDIVYGGQGNDLVRGGQDNDLLFGDKGDDTLGGDNGNDTIYGGGSNSSSSSDKDLIFGGSGDDLLFGNTGNDTIFAEDGNDTVYAGKDDDIVCGDAGNDLIFGDVGKDSLSGGDLNDTIYGGDDDDRICGGAENDLLSGNQGADWITGELGNDTLYGGQGNDTLIGGDGDDLLNGDKGNDLLTGGNGSDKFVLASGQSSDVITDFQDGIDSFALSGNLTFSQLSIVQSGNNTLISLASNNQLLATLNGISANLITVQDFVSV
ncbi:beta strand repeat-containing protein, partial [Aerosakkonemataceae cyanobacterium BLCC-F50]